MATLSVAGDRLLQLGYIETWQGPGWQESEGVRDSTNSKKSEGPDYLSKVKHGAMVMLKKVGTGVYEIAKFVQRGQKINTNELEIKTPEDLDALIKAPRLRDLPYKTRSALVSLSETSPRENAAEQENFLLNEISKYELNHPIRSRLEIEFDAAQTFRGNPERYLFGGKN